MTLKELKFELVNDNTAEAYVHASREPDEQIIIELVLDKDKRSAYTCIAVSTIEGNDTDRMFYTAANYAEAENILNKLKGN